MPYFGSSASLLISCAGEIFRSAQDFSYQAGRATFANTVSDLTAEGTSCDVARAVAGEVAWDLLHSYDVPSAIGGLTVTVTRPCGGCSPVFPVTATRTGQRVTFSVRGGTGGGASVPQS